jgi:hypothetical protein
MADLIDQCAADAANHGAFVSCVTSLTIQWRNDGLITGMQKVAIQKCAAHANLP